VSYASGCHACNYASLSPLSTAFPLFPAGLRIGATRERAFAHQTQRINIVDWIAPNISIEIGVSTIKPKKGDRFIFN